jgi:hypothetical protein
MGPIEIMHFQTFSDKAGNAPPLTDPTNGLTFPDLNSGKDPNNGSTGDAVRQMFQTNLIMRETRHLASAKPLLRVVWAGAATGLVKDRRYFNLHQPIL